MKVSILIVTYQSEDEILNCIKSIYQNVNKIIFEIIIVDNASTDKTIKIRINSHNLKYFFTI